MKTFKEYLAESKKVYPFKIKVAGDLPGGFEAKLKQQLFVYHVDGDLNNNSVLNLKTVCANCQYEIAQEGLGWRQGDLVPDF